MSFIFVTRCDTNLFLLIYLSDIDRSCRIVVYAIDASNIENVTIEKIGRLPLERSKVHK